MSDKIDERVWKNMPSLFWIVPPPNGAFQDSTPAAFAHQKSAEDYARKQAQVNDRYTRVFKVELHGTAVPQDSQFSPD